jgi:serine/threonine protein phosphatase PrpC/Leucine-rich repeat (LRR) protein
MGARASGPRLPPSQTYLSLTDSNLVSIPLKIPKCSRLSMLDLAGNSIRELPEHLPRLNSLTLSRNCLSEIPENMICALLHYRRMEILDLSVNSLLGFPPQLSNLQSLKRLILRDNQLTNFPKSSVRFEILDLAQNRLTCFPDIADAFEVCLDFNLIESFAKSLPSLTRLSLNMNRLQSIGPMLVFPALEVLHISRNLLTELPDLSQFAPRLKVFDASSNLLTEWPHFPLTVAKINLNDNMIENFPEDLSRFVNLAGLEVNSNRLCSVPVLPRSLDFFSASGNNITTVSACEMPKLKRISLHRNRLAAIPCYENSGVTELFLTRNNIQSIAVHSLPTCINRICLIGNRITAIPADLFTLPKLAHLNLGRNCLHSLPDTLKSSRLLTFAVSENPLGSIDVQLPETLIVLSACSCGLTQLPSSISGLSNLQILAVAGNMIDDVPDLPQTLKKLILSRNVLTTLPENLPASLCFLALSCNKIESLEGISLPNLVDFEVSHNRIRTLPSAMHLPALKSFKIANNIVEGSLDLALFPRLTCLDIAFTHLSITHPDSAELREIIVSDASLFVSSQFKLLSGDTRYVAYAETVGQRPTMEDSIVVRTGIFPSVDLFCVFDGHGGSATSSYSAFQIVQSLTSEFSEENIANVIVALTHSLQEMKFKDGSTMAMALVSGNEIIIAHLGDSRVIVVKSSGDVKFATQDHRTESRIEIDRILSVGGKITDGRTDGIVAVTRSLGDFAVRGMGREPEIRTLEIEEDDRWIVLACDGLLDVFTNEEVGEIARDAENARNLAYDLRNYACHRLSPDNISVIAVDLKHRA